MLRFLSPFLRRPRVLSSLLPSDVMPYGGSVTVTVTSQANANLDRTKRQVVITNGGSYDIIGPALPVDGDEIVLLDGDRSWATTTKQFAAPSPGRKVAGKPGTPLRLDGMQPSRLLVYDSASDNWVDASALGASIAGVATAASANHVIWANLFTLPVFGTWLMAARVHDAANINNVAVEYLIDYQSTGLVVAKHEQDVLAGTVITALDITGTSGGVLTFNATTTGELTAILSGRAHLYLPV